jgi:hypothetical protein
MMGLNIFKALVPVVATIGVALLSSTATIRAGIGDGVYMAQTQGGNRRQDRRQGRRQERPADRKDRQGDRVDCRQEQGAGKDKRDCKQGQRRERNTTNSTSDN